MVTMVPRKSDQGVRCPTRNEFSFESNIETKRGKFLPEVHHGSNFIEPDDASVDCLYFSKACTSNTPPTSKCVGVCRCACVENKCKQTRAELRQALVSETMRKFQSALINISHYLKSEKTQLNLTEVSAITAKLGELLTESNAANSSVVRDSAEIKKDRSGPPRFKETATSKFRRQHNTLKKQRLSEREDERLKWPEWNFGSSPNFRRPRLRDSALPPRAKSLNGKSKYGAKQCRLDFGNISLNRPFPGASEPDFPGQTTNGHSPRSWECLVSDPNISDKQDSENSNRPFSGALEPNFPGQISTNGHCPRNCECLVSAPNISDKQDSDNSKYGEKQCCVNLGTISQNRPFLGASEPNFPGQISTSGHCPRSCECLVSAPNISDNSKYGAKQCCVGFGNIIQNRPLPGAEPDFSGQTTNSHSPKSWKCLVSAPNISDKQDSENSKYGEKQCVGFGNISQNRPFPGALAPDFSDRSTNGPLSTVNGHCLRKCECLVSGPNILDKQDSENSSAKQCRIGFGNVSQNKPFTNISDKQDFACTLNGTTAKNARKLSRENVNLSPASKVPHRVSNFHQTVWRKVEERSARKFLQVEITDARPWFKYYPENASSGRVPQFLPERLSEMSVADLPELFPVTCQLLNENVSLSAARQLSTDRLVGGKVDGGDFLESDRLSNSTSSSAESETERRRKRSTFSPRLVKSSSFPPPCSPLSYGKQEYVKIAHEKDTRLSESEKENGSTTGMPNSAHSVLEIEPIEVISHESDIDQDEDSNWSTASGSGYETSWDTDFQF